jgi:hypothetical protein
MSHIMIRLLQSAEEPDAGNSLVRICGGLGSETAGPTRKKILKSSSKLTLFKTPEHWR